MLLQTTKPQFPHLQQGSPAALRRSRGSQRTPRHRSPQAPSHVLTPGEELRGCSLSKSLKALRDNVPMLTLCPCQQQGVNVHNTFYSSLRKHNSHSACSLFIHLCLVPTPCQNRGAAMTPTRLSPTNTHPPLTLELCLVASNLSYIRLTKHLQWHYQKWNHPFVTVPLARRELAECRHQQQGFSVWSLVEVLDPSGGALLLLVLSFC